MKVLIACEYSGSVRDAFLRLGHDAMSCDLLPTVEPGPHYQGDVFDIINDGWELMVAHPPCTFLTSSAAWALKDGPYHQKVKPGTLVGKARRDAQAEALEFVRALLDAPIEKIALENPVGRIGTAIRKADQYIHPHEFGHDASKRTGLWLKNLPLLAPTGIIKPRMVTGKPRWGNQTDSGQNILTPSDDRWKVRAETYQGIADAMAQQWGSDQAPEFKLV